MITTSPLETLRTQAHEIPPMGLVDLPPAPEMHMPNVDSRSILVGSGALVVAGVVALGVYRAENANGAVEAYNPISVGQCPDQTTKGSIISHANTLDSTIAGDVVAIKYNGITDGSICPKEVNTAQYTVKNNSEAPSESRLYSITLPKDFRFLSLKENGSQLFCSTETYSTGNRFNCASNLQMLQEQESDLSLDFQAEGKPSKTPQTLSANVMSNGQEDLDLVNNFVSTGVYVDPYENPGYKITMSKRVRFMQKGNVCVSGPLSISSSNSLLQAYWGKVRLAPSKQVKFTAGTARVLPNTRVFEQLPVFSHYRICTRKGTSAQGKITIDSYNGPIKTFSISFNSRNNRIGVRPVSVPTQK